MGSASNSTPPFCAVAPHSMPPTCPRSASPAASRRQDCRLACKSPGGRSTRRRCSGSGTPTSRPRTGTCAAQPGWSPEASCQSRCKNVSDLLWRGLTPTCHNNLGNWARHTSKGKGPAVRFSHQPDGYRCPFCRVAGGEDLRDDYTKQSDVVYRDDTVTAFISSAW